MYQAITKEDQAEIEVGLYDQVLKDSWNDRKEKNGEYLICHCKIQDIPFTTEMTVDELKTVARLTIDILEELKNIHNTGLNKEKFKELFQQYITENNDITGYFKIWEEAFRTEKMQLIFSEIDLINNPDASVGVCCSHKVVAVGFNTLCYDASVGVLNPPHE